MELYDLLMIAVLIAATLFGAWKGLVWQLAYLAAVIASYFVALRFREQVSVHVHAAPPWNVFVAMLVLFVSTSLAIWVLFRMVSKFIDRMRLKEFDRQLGAIFGFAKGLLLCVIITLFAVTLLGDNQRQMIVRSKSGLYIARLLDKSSAVMPREIHEVLAPYINTLDRQLHPSEGSQFDGPLPQSADNRLPGGVASPIDAAQEVWQSLSERRTASAPTYGSSAYGSPTTSAPASSRFETPASETPGYRASVYGQSAYDRR
jgi:membrane protein required for colicin V production